MSPPARIRHDLDLLVIHGTSTVPGRVVAYEDGRWSLRVLLAGRWAEARGDRWGGERAAAWLLLQAANPALAPAG